MIFWKWFGRNLLWPNRCIIPTFIWRLNKDLKSTIFWSITPCSPLSVNRRFGATYRLHLQGLQKKLSKKPAYFVDPEDGGYMFLLNVGWHSTDYTALYPRIWYSSQPPLSKPKILQIKIYFTILFQTEHSFSPYEIHLKEWTKSKMLPIKQRLSRVSRWKFITNLAFLCVKVQVCLSES
jgi:hypothetical protein